MKAVLISWFFFCFIYVWKSLQRREDSQALISLLLDKNLSFFHPGRTMSGFWAKLINDRSDQRRSLSILMITPCGVVPATINNDVPSIVGSEAR
ncbi:hypothetical protein RB195_001960 [Necator americanus]